MLNGMCWIVRSDAQWRELSEAYGPWQSVYARFAKWWGKTVDKAVGCIRNGLNTKIHTIVDGLGNQAEFLLSAGNDNDCVRAMELLENVEFCGSSVRPYRAYGA